MRGCAGVLRDGEKSGCAARLTGRRLAACVTPKPKVAGFCAAQWPDFTPPLTPREAAVAGSDQALADASRPDDRSALLDLAGDVDVGHLARAERHLHGIRPKTERTMMFEIALLVNCH